MSRLKVKFQGHQGQKTTFLAVSSACVRFMFGKTSLALVQRVHYVNTRVLMLWPVFMALTQINGRRSSNIMLISGASADDTALLGR